MTPHAQPLTTQQAADLLAYRELGRAAQYAALEATAVDVNDEQDLGAALEQLREARRAHRAYGRGWRAG